MNHTPCNKCFHFAACSEIDLTGAVGSPTAENLQCDHFIDAERVAIRDKAKWVEKKKQYRPDADVFVNYHCSRCGYNERTKLYSDKAWNEYHKDHYLEDISMDDLANFCKICGSEMIDIVEEG